MLFVNLVLIILYYESKEMKIISSMIRALYFDYSFIYIQRLYFIILFSFSVSAKLSHEIRISTPVGSRDRKP